MSHAIDAWKIFLSAKNRGRFLDALTKSFSRFDAKIVAYAAVANHYHLAILTGLVPLSVIMHHLNTTIGAAFNRSVKRSGAILRGRYRDILVDSERYLLALVRYIHLNVVRAGLTTVESLARDPGTSHSTFMGFHNHAFVDVDFVLERFGKNSADARAALHEFVIADLEPTPFDDEMDAILDGPEDGKPHIIGSPEFIAGASMKIVSATPRLALPPHQEFDELVLRTATSMNVSPRNLLDGERGHATSAARAAVVYAGIRELHMTAVELSHRLGISQAAVSKAYERARVRDCEQGTRHEESIRDVLVS